MTTWAAQLASAKVLYLFGDFPSDTPSKLHGVEDVRGAYLVPRHHEGRRCLVVEPAASITPQRPSGLHGLVKKIGDLLGYKPEQLELLRAVERRGAGEPAETVDDWARLH